VIVAHEQEFEGEEGANKDGMVIREPIKHGSKFFFYAYWTVHRLDI